MVKMKKKLKFSGMSFGGRKPSVVIFGKIYKLVFGRHRKEKSYGYEVKKRKRVDSLLKYFFFLFPLYDVFIYFSMNPPKAVTEAVKPVTQKMTEMTENIGGFYISSWGFMIILVLYFLTIWYLVYLLIFRGVRTWHGTEHKVISAAENNDLKNVKKYDPIHERCGGTLLPTIALGWFIWFVVYSITGFMYCEMTIITILIFLNIKVYHKYDKIGIWFGKKFQKYISISEPEDWQLKVGTEGMKNLLKAEQGKKYKKKGRIFGEKEIKTIRKKSIRSHIPITIITFLFVALVVGIVISPPLPEVDFMSPKYICFSGSENETKEGYLLVQINASQETLPIDKIRVWGLFDPVECNNDTNLTFNTTIYDGLSLYISENQTNTSYFINGTKNMDTGLNFWKMTEDNCPLLPIRENTLLNFTVTFKMPEGDYDETCVFNCSLMVRFTSYV